MTHDEMLTHIIEKIDRLDEKMDAVSSAYSEHRVQTEHRLTKVETKSSIFGTVGGVIGGFLAALLSVNGGK